MAGARIYNTGFRNKAEALKTIIPNPKSTAVCGGCGSIYEKKRWFEDAARARELKHDAKTDIVKCPACVRSKANYPEGILTISGEFLKEHHDDILHTITHTAKMERERDTLCRLMGVKSSEEMILVKTTNERLVRRLGHVLHSAYGGDLSFVFSHGIRLTRVRWHRDEPGRAIREQVNKKKTPMKNKSGAKKK
ncbi:MAG: BCAM0308 family protein [Planctomycetota bacterium]